LINSIRIVLNNERQPSASSALSAWDNVIMIYQKHKGANLLSKSYEGLLVGSLIAYINLHQLHTEFERAIIALEEGSGKNTRQFMFRLLDVDILDFRAISVKSPAASIFKVVVGEHGNAQNSYRTKVQIATSTVDAIEVTCRLYGDLTMAKKEFSQPKRLNVDFDGFTKFVLSIKN